MNEIDYYEMQENAATGQAICENLEAILADNGSGMTVADLYRSIYKNTECGPWLSVKLHDGTWRHCDELRGIDNGNVRALLVGSIVEGSDAEVTADPIDLGECESPEAAVELFNRTVDWVNDEACRLWDEANGEDEDDAHFNEFARVERMRDEMANDRYREMMDNSSNEDLC